MIGKNVWTIIKSIVHAVVLGATIAMIVCVSSGCSKDTSAAVQKPAPMYEDRMKFAGSSTAGDEIRANRMVYIWIDKETGVCYAAMPEGGMVMLADHDGKPFVANGWRDFAE